MRRLDVSMLRFYVGIPVACLATVYAAQSAILAATLRSPLPSWDIWWFIRSYFGYLDSGGALRRLFEQHNEHRIVTTRLILYLDARLFHFQGDFPILITYASLALIAVLVAACAAGRRGSRLEIGILAVCFLGLTWAVSQQENLGLPFQMSFPLVHLFALVCFAALALGLTDRRWPWYAIAVAADFFAVFSLASGAFVLLPALALPILLRRFSRDYAVTIGVMLLIRMLFLWGYDDKSGTSLYAYRGLFACAKFLTIYLGSFLAGRPADQSLTGVLLLATFFVLGAWACWSSIVRRQSVAAGVAVLLAIAAFVIIEGSSTAYSRIGMGYGQAAVSRYATPALVMVAAVVGIAWRLTSRPSWPGLASRACVAVLFALLIVHANPYMPSVLTWQFREGETNKAGLAFLDGVYPDEVVRRVWTSSASVIEADMLRLRDAGLAHFAGRLQPPVARLGGADARACRAFIDKVSSENGVLRVQGWALEPEAPWGVDWLVAYAGPTLLGATRTTDLRPDVAKVFALHEDRVGFVLFLDATRVEPGTPQILLRATTHSGPCTYAVGLP